jgi:hypothetical protein
MQRLQSLTAAKYIIKNLFKNALQRTNYSLQIILAMCREKRDEHIRGCYVCTNIKLYYNKIFKNMFLIIFNHLSLKVEVTFSKKKSS